MVSEPHPHAKSAAMMATENGSRLTMAFSNDGAAPEAGRSATRDAEFRQRAMPRRDLDLATCLPSRSNSHTPSHTNCHRSIFLTGNKGAARAGAV